MLKIPPKIEYVLTELEKNGYEAYIVGGCVRDSLLGLAPHDYDVTTSAKPEEVISVFERTVPTGIKHGTVTVLVENEPVEVTTFRTEGEYTDSRRPDRVEFVTDIESDLSRRDFTVNAMAYNHSTGLKDYFGGVNDLNEKILRAVGDPYKRFSEDALRILRLFRFASQLEFKIEEKTYEAALDLAHNLENISSERIFVELIKAVTGKNPTAIAPLLEGGGLDFLGFSKLMNFEELKSFSDNENLCLCAFLFATCQKPLDTLKKLKCSNSQYRYCENFLKLAKSPLPESKADIKNALAKTERTAVCHWLLYLENSADVSLLKKMLREIIENNEPYLISHLEIDGKALRELGFSGKQIGEKLEALRSAVVVSPELNTKEKLKELAKNI